MNIEAINMAVASSRPLDKPAERVEAKQKVKEDIVAQEPKVEQADVAPEELLQQIKSLTEDGLYSVQFAQDERVDQLVVKVIDRETDEVIRQVPPEELLDLSATLKGMRGNIVNTES